MPGPDPLVRKIGIVADDWPTAKAAWKLMRETKADAKEVVRLICYAPEKSRELKVGKAKKDAKTNNDVKSDKGKQQPR